MRQVAFLNRGLCIISVMEKNGRGKDRLVAKALLKYETLEAEDVQKIIDGGTLDKPTVGDLLAAEQKKGKQSDKKEKVKAEADPVDDEQEEREE